MPPDSPQTNLELLAEVPLLPRHKTAAPGPGRGQASCLVGCGCGAPPKSARLVQSKNKRLCTSVQKGQGGVEFAPPAAHGKQNSKPPMADRR